MLLELITLHLSYVLVFSLTHKYYTGREKLSEGKHSSLFFHIVISCKIFEHFALQVDPVIEFIQLGSTPFKDSTILAPKLADPPFWWKSDSTPSKSTSFIIVSSTEKKSFMTFCFLNSVSKLYRAAPSTTLMTSKVLFCQLILMLRLKLL